MPMPGAGKLLGKMLVEAIAAPGQKPPKNHGQAGYGQAPPPQPYYPYDQQTPPAGGAHPPPPAGAWGTQPPPPPPAGAYPYGYSQQQAPWPAAGGYGHGGKPGKNSHGGMEAAAVAAGASFLMKQFQTYMNDKPGSKPDAAATATAVPPAEGATEARPPLPTPEPSHDGTEQHRPEHVEAVVAGSTVPKTRPAHLQEAHERFILFLDSLAELSPSDSAVLLTSWAEAEVARLKDMSVVSTTHEVTAGVATLTV